MRFAISIVAVFGLMGLFASAARADDTGVAGSATVGTSANGSAGYYLNGQYYPGRYEGAASSGTTYGTTYSNAAMGYTTRYAPYDGGYRGGYYGYGGGSRGWAVRNSGYTGHTDYSGYTGYATYASYDQGGACGCERRCDSCCDRGLFGNGGFLGTGLFR